MTEDEVIRAEAEYTPPTRWERVKESFTIWFEKRFNPPPEETPFVPYPIVIDFHTLEEHQQQDEIESILSKIYSHEEVDNLIKLANLISLFKVMNVIELNNSLMKEISISKDVRITERFYQINFKGFFPTIQKIINNFNLIANGDELIFLKICTPSKIKIIEKSLDFLVKYAEFNKIISDASMASSQRIIEVIKTLKHYNKLVYECININVTTLNNSRYEKNFEKQARHFKEAGRRHACGAFFCLIGVLIFALLIIIWGMNNFCKFPSLKYIKDCHINIFKDMYYEKLNIYTFVYLISNKIIITITLFIILSVFSRGYFANNHNKVLNRQRYNAIKTCLYFYNATKGSEILLEKGTEAMFEQLPTGYTNLQSDKGGDNVSLADITRIISRIINKP